MDMTPDAQSGRVSSFRKRAGLAVIVLFALAGLVVGAVLIRCIAQQAPTGEPPTPAFTAKSTTFPPSDELAGLPAPSVPAGREPLSADNLASLAELGRFGQGWPSSVDFSPDGKRLAVGSSRGVEIFRAIGWLSQAVYESTSPVLVVSYSPDGQWLAVGQQDGSVILLNAKSAQTVKRLISHTHPVHGLAFSGVEETAQTPALLASGAEDGSVVVWDLESGMARYQFVNPLLGYWGYGIRSLAFSHDDRVLVTGGDQGYLSRWDLTTGEELPRLQTQHGLLFGIAFSPDGSRLASACGDGSVQIWDYGTEEPLALLQGHAFGAWSVDWTADGKELAAGSGDGTVKIWDPQSGTLLRERTAAFTKIDRLRYAPGDVSLAAVSIAERAFLLDSRSLDEIHSFDVFLGGLQSAAFSPSGEWAAFAGGNGTAYLWNMADGEGYVLGKARPQSNAATSAVFSPDAKMLAVADGLPGILRLYDAETLSLLSKLTVKGIRAIAFSPGGDFLAAGGSEGLTVWASDSLESQKADLPYRMTSLAFPTVPESGATLLAGGYEDGSMLLWNPDDPDVRVPLAAGSRYPVWILAASGPILAAGDDRGDLRIWNIATGRMIRTFSGYSGSIFALAISPDRSLLAAGGIQGSFRVWSLENGKLLRIIHAHNGWVTGLAFSPDGRWLLSAGSDGIGRAWGLQPPSDAS